jgi:2,4'-dihydroxyacetophenone dioxygenase
MTDAIATPTSPESVFPIGLADAAETMHIGLSDLPFIAVGKGVELQLLHVDLNSGLWINRTRLQPGASVATHLHAGLVLAVTLEGRWFYKESPDQVNIAGSYLFEPAGSVHTLQAAADQTGSTTAWFAIWGPNINIDENGQILSVLDARAILSIYRQRCAELGSDCSRMLVVGEHLS